MSGSAGRPPAGRGGQLVSRGPRASTAIGAALPLMRSDDLHPTHHALEQTAARSITLEEVAQALDEPETTYSSPRREDRITLLGTTKAGRRLKIVVPAADPHVIITVADRDHEG